MIIADLSRISGRTFPARRHTRNLAGGASPIQTKNFALGYVVLEPHGGQVPWHHHEQEEVYTLLEGRCEICLGTQRQLLTAGQAVFIPSGTFHQLTNLGSSPATIIYCYGPAGDVSHWKQELDGTLPQAGTGDTPPLPTGAQPQHTAIAAPAK